MAEDPKNPFTGVFNGRNAPGARAPGAGGGGGGGKLIGEGRFKSKADVDLRKEIFGAMEKFVAQKAREASGNKNIRDKVFPPISKKAANNVKGKKPQSGGVSGDISKAMSPFPKPKHLRPRRADNDNTYKTGGRF